MTDDTFGRMGSQNVNFFNKSKNISEKLKSDRDLTNIS